MTQQQKIDLSKELTEQYRNKTLPAGEYYFLHWQIRNIYRNLQTAEQS